MVETPSTEWKVDVDGCPIVGYRTISALAFDVRAGRAIWAVQLINRVRTDGFFRSRYFISVHAFFCIRLESIPGVRIYSGGMRFRLLMAELEILRTNCARSEIEMPKKGPQHMSSDLF